MTDSNREKKTVGFYGGKFSPVHLGHVRSIVKASTMVDELHVGIIADVDWEEKNLYRESTLKCPSLRQRERWLKQIFKNSPHVKIWSAAQPETGHPDEDWSRGAEEIWSHIGKKMDYIFSSEPEYETYFSRFYPSANHVLLDPLRKETTISATDIRRDGAFAHWDEIPSEIKGDFVKKVVLVGTESNGKSQLTQNLSRYYNTISVEEYGRAFMDEVNDQYTLPEDYPRIAMKHWLDVDDARKRANKILFVDTEAWVTQNFSLLYEGFHQDVISEIAKIQNYDLVLYLEPDVEWVNDGTRVFGTTEERSEADLHLKELLQKNSVDYVTVRGSYSDRLQTAIEAVSEVLF